MCLYNSVTKIFFSFTTINSNSDKNMYMFLTYQGYLIYQLVYITVQCTVLGSRIVELKEQGYRNIWSILA